ncbi:unnamed protein product [Porites evermanni]|uniref:Endonuclease/exonuclease/phosphatase domain-containing protein n=1 Tax=Porites evermanni TaxID=104178 RepID=A0ABN8R454_9CNID|nr:unnamed protein product [Porites evermanni]
MGHNNEFNLLSINVRGIRTFENLKAVFSWLVNSDADIFFLQETYSARDIENIWRKQWKGEMFFSHGSNHSRGTDKCSEQFLFFKDLSDILKGARVEQDHPFMVDGDFNIILDHVIDGQGGTRVRTVRTGSFAPGKGKLTTDPKQIMKELEAFYSDLYDGGEC